MRVNNCSRCGGCGLRDVKHRDPDDRPMVLRYAACRKCKGTSVDPIGNEYLDTEDAESVLSRAVSFPAVASIRTKT